MKPLKIVDSDEEIARKAREAFTNGIEIQLNEYDEFIKFNTVEELKSFLNKENEAWLWLEDFNTDAYDCIYNDFLRKHFFPVLTGLEKISVDWAAGKLSQAFSEFGAWKGILETFKFPFSNTKLGSKINSVAGDRPRVALYMILFSFRDYPRASANNHVHADFEGFFIPISSGNRPNKFHVQIMRDLDLVLEAQKELTLLKISRFLTGGDKIVPIELEKELGSLKKAVKDAEVASQELRNLKSFLEQENTDLCNKINADTTEMITSAKQTVQAAKDTYEAQIEIDASIKYWKAKEKTHSKEAESWYCRLLVLLVGCGFSPIVPYWCFSTDGMSAKKLVLGIYHPMHIFGTVLLLSIFSFAIRFASTQYSSQKHLFLESQERQTMLKTFLAFMNEGNIEGPNDKRVILETLFRPSQTGIIKDHGPIVPADNVINVFKDINGK